MESRTFRDSSKERKMSGEIPPIWKIVSPVKCNEKPWDSWIHEIGHSSPRQDEDTTAAASGRACDGKTNGGRRAGRKDRRYRRTGLNRLRTDTMSLHGLFPQSDNMNAAVCHMCGATVKCSAVYRHLLDSHTNADPILPPPPPAPTVKLKSLHRSRLKKELPPPPPPIDIVPVKLESSPIHTAPLSRVVLPPPQDLQYLEEPSTSSAVTGEVQVCVESGELPVVSIQDTDDLHLGENITDDIFAIMNSEGIQSAEDIANCPDWKNIIRDIGNMQDINFGQGDSLQSSDVYGNVDSSTLPPYSLPEELSNVQFAASVPTLPDVIDATAMITPQVLKQAPCKPPPPPPPSKSKSRSKSSTTKFNLREYDANKHCGVVTSENPKPCTRSLTCKAHALSLRRLVEGRVKPFDVLLAEHRASREAAAAPHPPPPPVSAPPPALDLAAFNGLTAEQQVQDIYASLLRVEEGGALPEATLSSLLAQPLPTEPFLLPDEAEVVDLPVISIAEPDRPPPPSLMQPLHLDLPIKEESPPTPVPTEICWYASSPRPLALCTFNASHAGGAVTLGKRFATVRNNIKSSLSRSQKAGGGGVSAGGYGFSGGALGSRGGGARSAELRRLVARCGAMAARRLPNGHVQPPAGKHPKRTPTSSLLDLGFVLDPLLADDKC